MTVTPATDMVIDADTFGSNYDTVLAVYTGPVDALTEVVCNDQASGGGDQSQVVNLAVSGGIRYLFLIGSFAFAPAGNLVLSVQQHSGLPSE
jgi:hypothetical protein